MNELGYFFISWISQASSAWEGGRGRGRGRGRGVGEEWERSGREVGEEREGEERVRERRGREGGREGEGEKNQLDGHIINMASRERGRERGRERET